MIKMVYCIRKRADISDEDFHTYWRDKHGTFVRGYAQTIRAKKYIQCHTMNTPLNEMLATSRGTQTPPYDGVTEIWWESEEDFLAGNGWPEGLEAGKKFVEDEANFVDFSQSRVFVTEEHVVFDFSSQNEG